MECLPSLALLVVFGFLWFRDPGELDAHTLPLAVIGLMSMFCFPMELARNLFGFDGQGFRICRFAGVPATTLLLGKYLALLPLFILLAGAVLTVSAVLVSMLPTHILGTVFQGGIFFGLLRDGWRFLDGFAARRVAHVDDQSRWLRRSLPVAID